MVMKFRYIILVFLGLSICSCSDAQKETTSQPQEEIVNYSQEGPISWLQNELTEPEEKALDALDKIQVSGWQLYSTFPSLNHDCQGINSSFRITQAQFHDALLDLLNQYYLDLPEEERIELASTASKAQDKYIVRTCGATTEKLIMEESVAPPRKGRWIFRSLLAQRDLVINWEYTPKP